MRASRRGLLGVLLLVPLAPTAWAADPPGGDLAARVDAVFASYTADTPGCAVGVSKDGKEILTRAYGSADLEHGVANTADTVFEAGSVSKQFTAAAILLLAQAGKLKLDDPVRDYVPELPDYGTPEITLRHLLHHTSGLRDWGTVTFAAGWPRGSRVHTHAHVLDVLSRQKSLNFPPGAEYSYSNSGYNLMAIIVERVSGKTFAQYTRDVIFEPLGMTHTEWRDDYTRIVKGRAERVWKGGRRLPPADAVRERARQRRPAHDGRRSAEVEPQFHDRARGRPRADHGAAAAGEAQRRAGDLVRARARGLPLPRCARDQPLRIDRGLSRVPDPLPGPGGVGSASSATTATPRPATSLITWPRSSSGTRSRLPSCRRRPPWTSRPSSAGWGSIATRARASLSA